MGGAMRWSVVWFCVGACTVPVDDDTKGDGTDGIDDFDTDSNPDDTDNTDSDHTDAPLGAADVHLAIDVADHVGPVPPLGVNKGPLMGGRFGGSTYDFTSLYQAFSVGSIRAHDGSVDVCKIYSDDTLTLTPANTPLDADVCTYEPTGPTEAARWSVNDVGTITAPGSYDWTSADAEVDAILDGGFEWMLRLGDSFNGPNDNDSAADWARVAGQIYRHYAVGWPAPTVDTTRAPRWVEIHNEPDGMFWNGDAAQFYDMHELLYDDLVSFEDPSLDEPAVGGAGFTDRGVSSWLTGTGFVDGFMAEHGADRLQFLSIHHYNECDEALLTRLADYLMDVRGAVDAMSPGLPVLVTEWNIGLGSQCGNDLFGTQQAAAYAGAASAIFADPDVGVAGTWFYAGTPIMSAFAMDETDQSMSANPLAWALAFHGRLSGGTGIRTEICDPDGTGCVGGAVAAANGVGVAARAAVHASGEIGVAVSNYSDAAVTVNLDAGTTGGWNVHRRLGPTTRMETETAPNGRLVPTALALAAAIAEETVEDPVTSDTLVQFDLAPFEVVFLLGNP